MFKFFGKKKLQLSQLPMAKQTAPSSVKTVDKNTPVIPRNIEQNPEENSERNTEQISDQNPEQNREQPK